MADQTPNPTPEGQGGGAPATPPAKTGDDKNNPPAPTIRDEDVVAHPVYKGVYNDLKDTRARLQKLEDAQTDAEKKKLAETGEFKTLAEKAQAEAADLKGKYEHSVRYNAFMAAAIKAGVTLVEDAWKLADSSKLVIDANGAVAGAEDIVKELVASRPFLAGKAPAPKSGAPSNPPKDGTDPGAKRTYKRSELRDTKFFAEHKADIMLAAKEGRITND
jgi:hypothetical protein